MKNVAKIQYLKSSWLQIDRKKGVLTTKSVYVIVSNLGGIFLIAIEIGTYLKINGINVIIMW
jgi:hypothetical protein